MRRSQNRKNNSEEEYDITKSMIKSMKLMLTEAVVDGIYEVDPQEVREEELKFVDAVSKRVDFNDLKVYVTGNGNVEWSGVILQYGIEWKYSLESSTGVYMTSNLLQLTDDALNVISRLAAYYDIWASEWSDKLADIMGKEGVEEIEAEEGDL
tara:strand:- start:132 stop:590 length:459 start_codon:yes stop_codon:yes gene_type:complete